METTTTKKRNWIAIGFGIALLLALSALFKTCESLKVSENNLTIKNDSIDNYYKLKNGDLVASKKQLVLDKQQLKEQVLSKDKAMAEIVKKFSKVDHVTNSAVSYTKSVAVAHDITPKQDSTKTSKSPSSGPAQKNLFSGTFTDDFTEIKYCIDADSAYFDHESWTEMKEVYGYKRKWFLGRQEPTVDISFTNPDFTITKVTSVKLEYKVPFYNTRVFNISVGFIAGALLFNQ